MNKTFSPKSHHPNKYQTLITFQNLEEHLSRLAEEGKGSDLIEIEKKIKNELFSKLDYSDPKIVKNLLTLLPEFIYNLSHREDTKEGDVKTIPIPNFSSLLLKIIDMREHEEIENILHELLPLIYVLDERNFGASSCIIGMKFARELFENESLENSRDFQGRTSLGIRLMALLIRSRIDIDYFSIFESIESTIFIKNKQNLSSNIQKEYKYFAYEPYVRKNGYIALRDILIRRGPADDFNFIDEKHPIYDKIYQLMKKIRICSSREKNQFNKSFIAKGNNIFLVHNTENTQNNSANNPKNDTFNNKSLFVVEMDPYVQCAYIQVLPYLPETDILEIPNSLFDYDNFKKLAWNVQLSFINAIRTNLKLLLKNILLEKYSSILIPTFSNSIYDSDIHKSCILSLYAFLKRIQEIKLSSLKNELQNYNRNSNLQGRPSSSISCPNSVPIRNITRHQLLNPLVYSINHTIKSNVCDLVKDIHEKLRKLETPETLEQHEKFVNQILPLYTEIFVTYPDLVSDEYIEIINNYSKKKKKLCKLYLNPFFYKIISNKSIKLSDEIFELMMSNATHAIEAILYSTKIESIHPKKSGGDETCILNKDYYDRLFVIEQINLFADSKIAKIQNLAKSMIFKCIDMISNDPVYEIRELSIKTVLKLLEPKMNIDLCDALQHIKNIYAKACINGKKSLLSLVASIILSIDLNSDENDRAMLFSKYINYIFERTNDVNNKMIEEYFADLLQGIWPILPENKNTITKHNRNGNNK